MNSPLHVAIVGAHGQIARHLTRLLVARDHAVRGLVRNADQFDDIRADGAEPGLCDVETASEADLVVALEGCDVVVFAAGAGPDSGPQRKKTVDRDGAIHAADAAVKVGAARFVIVSSMGADDPPDDDETFSVYLRAKHDADEAVRRSSDEFGIVHTIVRPGRLSDAESTGTIELGSAVGRGEIPRQDVAALLAELIDTRTGADQTIEVISGSTAITDAVGSLD